MMKLYTWNTPNGYKPAILLEELGREYELVPINIGKDEQFAPTYLAINPNNKIPALVDTDAGITIFESGAILMYLSEKDGTFFPQDTKGKYETLQWLFFQVASVGPMLGQLGHFLKDTPEIIPYAVERFQKESERLYKVMDGHLQTHEYFGPAYGIADIALFTWVRSRKHKQTMEKFPNMQRWFDAIAQRPAVTRGIAKVNGMVDAAKAAPSVCAVE